MSETPETDAVAEKNIYGVACKVDVDFARKLERERDEARSELSLKQQTLTIAEGTLSDLRKELNEWAAMCGRYKQERDEAQKELSSIHQWIERNHPDGFIDSLTHLQNLDRVTDNWYDRLDRLEVDANRFVRERDEAREQLRKASVEANTLAKSIQKTEYPDAKEFELLGSVAGVISQIDNMYAGLRQQRDEAREEIKDLIYIAERAIDLAEIYFENDKFGVVSELRDGVERIKEGAK